VTSHVLSRARRSFDLIALAGTIGIIVLTHPGEAAESDPNLEAVQIVCGKCHTTTVFMKEPRSWERWNDVFADMTRRGAKGTDEQLEQVTKYFLENLTLVNINHSPSDELVWVLGMSEEAAQSIIARRERQPFTDITQLRSVPGVNAEKLQQRRNRILF
jgi:DNA uptake protein ComE-like DNA-binding protein